MTYTLSETDLSEAGINASVQKRWQRIFRTPGGEELLKDIYTLCGLYNISHTPGDPHTTAYLDGRRSVAVWIYNVMEAELNLDEQAMLDEEETIESVIANTADGDGSLI